MKRRLITMARGEEGHAAPLLGILVAAAGAIGLAIGAVNDEDAVTIIGGIVLGLGLIASSVIRHMTIDYEMFRRTDRKTTPEA